MKTGLTSTWVHLLVLGAVFAYVTEARKIRVQRPLQQEEEQETVQYYAAEPQEGEHRQVVLVSSADQYNGYYGQPTAASSRRDEDNYIPRGSTKASGISSRVKENPRPPPVQTIRNYNKVNDDGSFTFGYEAADGSFKEETRGTDCVVRGKYGYVDPDGNKREFTYVSGNPCDPNAPKDEEDLADENESNENENVPANYPTRPIQPRPIAVTPKPVTLFQNTYDQSEDVQPEPEQLLRATPAPVRRPQYISRPQYYQQAEADEQQTYQRPQVVPSSTPASVIYRQSPRPVSITPRPQTVSPTPTPTRSQLPATTYRPQLLQVSVTPRPALQYTKGYSSTFAPSKNVDFEAEFQRFQTQNSIGTPTPSSFVKTTPNPTGQVYSSALVYDPASGQYKTQLYQSLPQTEGEFSFNHRIQPYVHQPQRAPQILNIQQLQQSQQPLYTQSVRQQVAPQAVYQAQQAEAQFQNSAQLYAQQQKARTQQLQQQARPHQQQLRQQAQAPVYYVQPSLDSTGAVGASQIDAFLRGHNIQF